MWAAIGSHYRFMKSLGQKPQEVPPHASTIKEADLKATDLVLQ
jgi:hypothetical protein